MNHQEAKVILQAYRPGGQDIADPVFAEALENVRSHPELQKWFAQERALDLHIRNKLRYAIPIPSGLRTNLLNLRKAARLAPGRCQPFWLNTPLRMNFRDLNRP